MSYECVIHGTSIDKFEKIIKSSSLISIDKKSIASYVYTYYVSDKIKINIFELYRFLTICNNDFEEDLVLIIRPEILRDEPFIACEMEHYGLGCGDSSIMSGTGKYKKIPSMKPLIDEINKNRTHELVFNKIDLDYVVAIIGESKYKKYVESICSSIPFISVDKNEDCESNIIKTFQTYGSDKYKMEKISGKPPSISLFELKRISYEFAIRKNEYYIENVKDELETKKLSEKKIIELTKYLISLKRNFRQSKKAYENFLLLNKTRKNRKDNKI